MLLTAFIFLITALAVVSTVSSLAEKIVEGWAPRYIIKQVLYDRNRILQPIQDEILRSKQLASSQLIKEWALDADNEFLREKSLQELEKYRLSFRDHNYFLALLNNGHYYHNNASNEYEGREFIYILDENKAEDKWFYDFLQQSRDVHISVNPDVELGITQLWIDVLIRDGEQAVGMVGTGLDLNRFFTELNETNEEGTISLLLDHVGEIQWQSNQTSDDFSQQLTLSAKHQVIHSLFQSEQDQQKIAQAMQKLERGESGVITEFVHYSGQRTLAGLTG